MLAELADVKRRWYIVLSDCCGPRAAQRVIVTWVRGGHPQAAIGVVGARNPGYHWQNRLAPLVTFLQQTGAWFVPHPFFDLFLPSRVTNSNVAGVLADLTLDDTGQGPVLLYPFKTSKVTQPFLKVPHEDLVFLFDILRFAVPSLPAVVSAMVTKNRALFEQARALGAKRYPIGSMPFTRDDWRVHYGSDWFFLLLQKTRFDPRHVLTPGQGIFVPTEEECQYLRPDLNDCGS